MQTSYILPASIIHGMMPILFSRKSKLIHGIEQRANGMIQMECMPILIRLKNGKDCKSTSFQWRTNQFYFSQFGHQYKYLSLSFPDIS